MHASQLEATALIPAAPRLPPEPRKRPKQSRPRILVASPNEACRRIARRERELNMTEIAAVAGVAMGSIYQYFPSLEAVIASAFEQAILDEIDLIRQRSKADW